MINKKSTENEKLEGITCYNSRSDLIAKERGV